MRPVPRVSNDDVWNGNADHIPAREEIPEEFWGFGRENKWKNIYYRWFYDGLQDGTEFIPKIGINKNPAVNAISAIMRSYKPEHNHKSAACSFLLSEWFEDVIIP